MQQDCYLSSPGMRTVVLQSERPEEAEVESIGTEGGPMSG